jgi:hypothetical protein
MRAIVTTLIRQELEVPEDWDKQEVYNFLSENQSFRDAFEGVSNTDQTARIVDVIVVDESIEQIGEECFDE